MVLPCATGHFEGPGSNAYGKPREQSNCLNSFESHFGLVSIVRRFHARQAVQVCSPLFRERGVRKIRDIMQLMMSTRRGMPNSASIAKRSSVSLRRRFARANGGARESVFAWLRNYAQTLNNMSPITHQFKLRYYSKKT